MRKRRYKLFFLLKALCQHADEFGFGYPGNDLLQELSGLGTEAMLNEGLQFLVDGEYIKIWESWNQRRRAWDRDFQLSPAVLYIREELHAYCVKVWDSGERDFAFESSIVIKRNGQPDSEPESEPDSVTRITNHHHHPDKVAAKQLTTPSAQDYENQPEGQQRKRRKPSSDKARTTEKENPQAGGAPPPEKIDLRRYQSPLPRPDDEDQAQDMQIVFRMRISQARGLVANYGRDQVGAAAAAVKDAMETGRCHNPAGLLTHLLKRGGSSPQDSSLYPSQQEKMAAATAAMNASSD